MKGYIFAALMVSFIVLLCCCNQNAVQPVQEENTATPLGEVTNLAVSCENGADGKVNAVLSWTDSADADLSGIEISYCEKTDTASIASSKSNKSVMVTPGCGTATVTGLTSGKTYVFTVRAVNTANIKSSGVQIEVKAVRTYSAEVSGIKITSDDKAVNLSWTNPEDEDFNGTFIRMEHEGASSIVELDSASKSYSYTTGEHGESYDFTVYAVDRYGISSSGTAVSALFLNYDEFENPIMLITLPEGVDDITTKTWLEDQGYEDLALCQIIDNSTPSNNAEFNLDIKGRGNSSWWNMPKRSYSLKLDKKANLFKMANGKHKNYALIANYCDKTLIRNQIAYYLGTDIFTGMDWNPHTQQVNLIVNGKYYGVYLLTERIKINEKIIDIPDVSDIENLKDVNKDGVIDFADGGWIVEVNARSDETYNWQTSHNIPISLKDPDDYSDWTKIQDYLNKVEWVLYGDDFTNPDEGWRKYLDEDSFIDWYLVNEVAKNTDAGWYTSVYMYFNPEDGKIHMGPLWDFDVGFGNINYNGCDSYEGFWIKNAGWHSRLFQDSSFISAVKARWAEKKSELEALVGTPSYSMITSISEFIDKLKTDAEVNFNLWRILGTYVWYNAEGYEARTTYQSEVDYLSSWLKNRIDWLDTAINSL